jgi:hypothetical protein
MFAVSSTVTIAVCCAVGAGSVALAQVPETGAEPVRDPQAVDEVIVEGRSLGALRSEIIRAEEAVFARFNDINSDDEFDIDCRMEIPLGSRIPRRVCRANYWRDVEVDIADEAVRWMQGSTYSGPGQTARGLQPYKGKLLHDEIRQLAAEDQQFRAALTELGTAHLKVAEEAGTPPSTADSASRQLPRGEDGLPYGAETVIEVRVGRKPWMQALTSRTFTLARVYGEIRSVDVECAERKARLQYEIGVEWNIPATWGSCTLTVDASRDTTFALYEFSSGRRVLSRRRAHREPQTSGCARSTSSAARR